MTELEQSNPEAASTPPGAMPPGYPADLECDVSTSLGTTLHVRPIRPDDAARLIGFHQALTPRSVYRRFFSAHPKLSDAEVKRFTCVDYVDRLALIAEVDNQLVGVARYDRLAGTPDAEVAFVVADEFQHHGVGTVLLELLANAAWHSGITTFVASTLAENRDMLGVFTGSRFDVTTKLDFGIVEVRFSIDPSSCRHAATHGYTEPDSQPNDPPAC